MSSRVTLKNFVVVLSHLDFSFEIRKKITKFRQDYNKSDFNSLSSKKYNRQKRYLYKVYQSNLVAK